MRITEIEEQTSTGGWENLDTKRTPSVLWDQIPPYYRSSFGVWALNPSKTNTPLMAIGDVGIWGKVINAEHFSKDYVSAKLTELAKVTGKKKFSARSGWVWRNDQAVAFFDLFSFPRIAPAENTEFWYEVPLDQEILGIALSNKQTMFDKCYATLPKKAFESANSFLDEIYRAWKVFTKDGNIISISGNVPSNSLQNLVDAVKLSDTTQAHGSRWVIYDGQVEDLYKAAFSEPDGSLSDGTKIWKVPSYVLPALSVIQFEKTWKTADSAFLALLPRHAGTDLNHTVLVGLRKGSLLGMARGNLSNATEPELNQLATLLSSEKGVGAGKEKFIKPGSKFHKMLRYLQDNPGGPRSGWYNKGLGLSVQGMPPIGSPKSLDGLASRLGLLTLKDPDDKPTQYHIRLTRAGELMLSRLDAGKALPMSMLMARLKK